MAAGEDVAMIATVVTILFSVAVLGWAVMYKCTNTSLKLDDFNLNTCLGFLLPPPPPPVTPEADVTPTSLLSKNKSVIQDDDDDDEYYTYVNNFNELDTKIIGDDYTDIAARTVGECAKICFENQVGVGTGASQCGGFISEYKDITSDLDRVKCRLYPKGNLSDSTVQSFLTRSFYLKGQEIPRI
jgi:hypothetical protein